MTSTREVIYRRRSDNEAKIYNVIFTDDAKVTFVNEGHNCVLPINSFNELYEKCI